MSDDWRSLLEQAEQARREARFNDALQLCDRAGQAERRARYPAILLRGDLLFELGDASGALSAYDSIADPDVDDTDLDLRRGTVLFHLVRFPEADNALRSAIRGDSALAEAYYTLGLIAEVQGSGEDIDLFRRARRLAPDVYRGPPQTTRAEFEELVDQALEGVAPPVAEALQHLRIVITEVPHIDDLCSVDPPISPTALGMFVTQARNGSRAAEPAILLFKRNLERAFHDRSALAAELRTTVLCEIAGLHDL